MFFIENVKEKYIFVTEIEETMKRLILIILCALSVVQVEAQSRPTSSRSSSRPTKTTQPPRKTYAERVADSIAGKYGPDNVYINNVVTVESSVQNVTATDITIERTVITNVLIENVICEYLTLTNATIQELKIRNCKIDDFLIENSSVGSMTVEDSKIDAFESDESTIRRQIFMAKEEQPEEVKSGSTTSKSKYGQRTPSSTSSSQTKSSTKRKGQRR